MSRECVRYHSLRGPNYRLPKVLRDYPELRGIGKVTRLQSLRCVRLVLWDEKQPGWFRSATSGVGFRKPKWFATWPPRQNGDVATRSRSTTDVDTDYGAAEAVHDCVAPLKRRSRDRKRRAGYKAGRDF
jgi:hypothetical protein